MAHALDFVPGQEVGYGNNTLIPGQRVELSPHLDRWMMGDRYGTVVGYATPAKGVSVIAERGRVREDGAVIYAVKLDVSGKRIMLASTNLQPR